MQQANVHADGELETQLRALQQALATNAAEVAAALAKLCVLLPYASEPALLGLKDHLQQLVDSLGVSDQHAQANALAVLAAAACQSEELLAEVTSAAGPQLQQLLVSPAAAAQSSSWRINLFSLLGQLARDQEAFASSLCQPAALQVVVAACEQQDADDKEQEAMGDVLCALCCHEDLRGTLAAAGVVGAAAQLLVQSQQADVRVRALLALGMLLPNVPEAPQQLLEAPGAVPALLESLKQPDQDCKVIARDLLALLMQDSQRKAAVEGLLREQLSADAAGAAEAAPAAGS